MTKRRHRKQKLPSEPVELDITALSHEGRGVAHIDGKVAFVDGALASERVSASYIRRRGKFDELRTEAVLEAAPERVEPPCQYAGLCGGCSLLHMENQAQIEFKQQTLLEQLKHTAKIEVDDISVLPYLRSDTLHYRRKARLGVRLVHKKGGALVGFREKYSSFIADMQDCKVLVEEVAALIPVLRSTITTLRANQHIPQIEVAVGEYLDDGIEKNSVALVIRHLQPIDDADLQVLVQLAEEHQFHLYLQPAGLESVHKVYPADNIQRLQYFLPDFGLRMNFHPMDFTQINAGINRLIIKQALGLLELNKDDVVLDLFCGLGNFTLPVATLCKQVVGVEGSDEMVRRGNENAKLNGISNAEFYSANLCDSLQDKSWSKISYSKILLDPPRSGAIEIIQQIAQMGASKIVYISCNPSTLARDTAELVRHGYKLKSAGVMDMFPHTTHVESMAEFERLN